MADIAIRQLATVTLNGSTNSVVFSSIPTTDWGGNTIRDLKIVYHGTGARYLALQMNGDTGGNYSTIGGYANGSTVGTGYLHSHTYIFASWAAGTTTTTRYGSIDLIDAKTTTKFTTALIRHGDGQGMVEINCGAWKNTAAITSIKIYGDSGTNFGAGTTISLYSVMGA